MSIKLQVFRKILVIICSVFFLSIFHCQKTSVEEIDSLYKNYDKQVFNNPNLLDERISFNKKMIEKAKEIDYEFGVAKGYYNIGAILWTKGLYKESIEYLTQAESIAKDLNNEEFLSEIYIRLSHNYYSLKLYEKSLEQCWKANTKIKKIKDKKRQITALGHINTVKLANYGELKNRDSIYYFLTAAYRSFDDDKRPLVPYGNIATFHINHNNLDSAKYYLGLATEKAKVKKYLDFETSFLSSVWGDYYLKKNDNKNALIYYNKSLKDAQSLGNKNLIAKIYKKLYEINEKSGNFEKSNEISKKIIEIDDSVSEIRNRGVKKSIEKFLDEKTTEDEDKRIKLYFLIFIIILIGTATIYLIILKKKRSIAKLELDQKNIISEKGLENIALQHKVNEAFDGVVELAKKNSPLFFTRFSEVYPQFTPNLLAIQPHLQTNELTLMAYIFLNFSTQDIADYTFRSYRTIQSRKYLLRKKLGLDSGKDLHVWIEQKCR